MSIAFITIMSVILTWAVIISSSIFCIRRYCNDPDEESEDEDENKNKDENKNEEETKHFPSP